MTTNNLPLETQRTIAAVTSRFFLIQPDGTIRRLNDFGKAIEWCSHQRATALRYAGRNPGARVFDKATGRFVD